MSKNLSRILIIVIAIGATAVIVLASWWAFVKPESKVTQTVNPTPIITQVTQEVIISVTDSQNKVTEYEQAYQSSKTAFEYLNELKQADSTFSYEYSESDYGVFVTAINGYKPDINQEYWEFKINGESSVVGISAYTVNAGDKLEFILTKISAI